MLIEDYILLLLLALFVVGVAIGGYFYETMTPEEKRRFEQKRKWNKRKKHLQKSHSWVDDLSIWD